MGVVIKEKQIRKKPVNLVGDSFIIPDNYLNIADESAQSNQRNFVKDYDDGYENLAEIGSFNKEKSGLYDLSGNLSEWVHDYYTVTFSDKIEKDPLGKKGSSHVIKGANWSSGTLTKLGLVIEKMV